MGGNPWHGSEVYYSEHPNHEILSFFCLFVSFVSFVKVCGVLFVL